MTKAFDNKDEPTAEDLAHEVDEARWVWQEAARLYGLHRELAYLYRTGSKDRRTIDALWDRIEEGEYALKMIGVEL